jgi:hypothetical protein
MGVDPATYAVDRHVTQTPWATLSGTPGRLAAGVYYDDANSNGIWDTGETVWADVSTATAGVAGGYDVGTDVLIHSTTPAPTAAITGPTVRPLVMYYNDVSGDRFWQSGEDAWIDYINTASWYEAQPSPWAQAMGLALYLKFDDAGTSIEDYAWHADWRAFWVHALRPESSGLVMADIVLDGNDAPTAPQVRIIPATTGRLVAMDALLRAEITMPSTDPDGLRVQYRYNWFLGTALPSQSTLPTGFVDVPAAGQLYGNGVWDEGEVIFSDIDGDGVKDAGEPQLIGTSAALGHALTFDLATHGALAGQFYYVVVVPVDELGKEGPFALSYVQTTTEESPNRLQFLSLTPESAQQGDALVLTLRNTNPGVVSVIIDWYRNAERFTSSTVGGVPANSNVTLTLDGSLTNRGDIWSFMAYASNIRGGLSRPTYGTSSTTGAQTRVTRVIGGGAGSATENLPPSAPTHVLATPEEALDADLLICTASGSVDPEGDAFAYYYQWYRLRTPETAYAPILGEVQPILSETLTLPGDRWFCQAYALDVYGNRSVTISSNPITINPTLTGAYAYEPNNTYNQARRILPKSNPVLLTDTAVQTHMFGSNEDRDWFWFVVEDGAGYERLRVTFETSSLTAMWGAYYLANAEAGDTVLALYRANGTKVPNFIRQIDDVGVVGQLGGSRYARIEADLTPGIYYVQVWTNLVVDAANGTYLAHLWFEIPSSASGPSAPTSVALRPLQPTASDDLVCEAAGGVSPLGEANLSYKYVWFRNGQVVPFGGGAQTYEGNNYILANAKPALSPDGSPANVVPRGYTQEGEVWTCQVFSSDGNGESAGVLSNAVTIGNVTWSQTLQVAKTFSDGTAAVTQDVTIGWLFGATHGFDLDIDADLPTSVPPPGDPNGPPVGPGGTGTSPVMAPAGSAFIVGYESEHSRLTTDLRPYGDMTSWYLKVELGRNPATCRLTWDALALPVTDTPLTITRVEEGPYGELYPVYGTTMDMSTTAGITIPPQEIADIVAADGSSTQGHTVLFRISLGTGDDTQTLELVYGWNMVSFAIQPITPAVGSVFSFNGQRVIAGVAWAYENGGYVPVTEIKAKVGYWVFCPFPSGATFTVHGLAVGGQLELTTGWNLVGPVVTTNVNTAYGAFGKAPQGTGAVDLDSIRGLNPSTMDYEHADILVPGRAYWINALRNVELPSPRVQ